MERIVLEVEDSLGKAWRNTSPRLRSQIEKNLELLIADSLSKTREANFELLLQDARKEAAANGLTEEVLAQLLNEEDSCYVLDTDTLISAFLLHENSTAARAWYKARSSGRILISNETFNEFSDVFVRPKFDRYLSLPKRLVIIEDLKTLVEFIPITTIINACRDPKDNKFLSLAIDAGASCIVTGDKDLLVLHPFADIPILTAADFLTAF